MWGGVAGCLQGVMVGLERLNKEPAATIYVISQRIGHFHYLLSFCGEKQDTAAQEITSISKHQEKRQEILFFLLL